MKAFISTDTAIIVSLWVKDMPNLKKRIVEYSTPGTKLKEILDSKIVLLEQQQIRDSLAHASAIVKQALQTTSILQKELNGSTSQLDALTKHRSHIESTLTKLVTLAQNKNT